MTRADFDAAIRRELALTIDLDARRTLVDALDQGPDSLAWRDAMAIVDLREIARRQMAAPGRERADHLWQRVDVELQRQQRRGQFVAIAAQIGVIALAACIGLLLGWCLVREVMRSGWL